MLFFFEIFQRQKGRMEPIFQVEIYLHCSHSAFKHISTFRKLEQQFQEKLMNCYFEWRSLLILRCLSGFKSNPSTKTVDIASL